MNILIVYDSYFGNTKEIAYMIAGELEEGNEMKIVKADNVEKEDMNDIDLLVIGSPTRAFKPSPKITKFMKQIEYGRLNGVKVAVFDTRISKEDTNLKILKGMIKIFGYAANPMAKFLAKKGGEIVMEPIGFYVADTEGPIKDGEKDRLIQWIGEIK
ncbi:MAG: flavodoxin domain-containing protein [Bacillota bacterium]|nr:flavodoxin domain-containing protein [Bacillota bacterium]